MATKRTARIASTPIEACNGQQRDRERFITDIRTALQGRGLSPEWVSILIEQDAGYIETSFDDSLSVDKVAAEVYDVEPAKTLEEFTSRVAELMVQGGMTSADAKAAMASEQAYLSSLFDDKGAPSEAAGVIADLIRKKGSGSRAPRLTATYQPTPTARVLLDQAIEMGLWGSTMDAVVNALVNRGLENLMKQGFLTLPKPTP